MALTTEQSEWISTISGLAIKQRVLDQQRDEKDGRAREMGVKLDLAKETIREELTISIKRKGFRPGSLKVLDEEGGQMSEFDISDVDKVRLQQEYLTQMSAALAKVERIAAEMREAKTPRLDEATGKPVLDEKGKQIMVPLYTDEEITEEVYMPLVRERLIPESLVPGKYSKTQQMIDASDKLYKERLAEYTKETEQDSDFLDSVKMFGDKLGDVAERAAKMFPGKEAELAATCISLAKLSFTTTITAVQVLSRDELDGLSTQVIDNLGKIAGGIVSAAVSPEVGKQVESIYGAVVTGPNIAIHLCRNPPSIDKAIEALASGLESAIGAGMKKSGSTPNPTQAAIASTICSLVRNSARAPRIAKALEDGDRNAVIDEFNGLAQDMLKASSNLASAIGKDKGTVDPKQVELISGKLSTSLDTLSKGVKLGGAITDAVKAKEITLMAQNIVDGLGDVLGSAVGTFAPPQVARQVSAGYTAATSASMVAFYLTRAECDQGNALRALAKGFGSSLAMINPNDPSVAKLGSLVEAAIVNAGNSVDMAKAIRTGRYEDAVKQMKLIANSVIAKTFDLKGGSKDGTQSDVEDVTNEISQMVGEIAKVKDALSKQDAEAELEARVNELRGQKALEDLDANRQDVRRALVQRDESGKSAADSRNIEILIRQMIKDRMIMELATKLVSGGVGTVAKFVPVLGGADAAIGLAVNLMKAAERAMELNKWVKNQKDMHRAVSSFESSAQNFVKNQAEQFSHYSIQAACKLAQLIGEIVKCSGLAAAAGEAVSKGAALAAAAEEISYQFYKEADLVRAWNATRKAWDHPESRKLQLIARSLNPTLAKYTLAWGAAVKKDALAMEAMATCGLNELTLSDPKANVNKVQAYLETMFNEDNVVLRRVVVPDWMPDAVTLTARCWGTAKARGVKEADLLDESTGAIDEGIAQVELLRVEVQQHQKIIDRTKDVSPDQKQQLATVRLQFIDALVACQTALHNYTPKNAKDKQVHLEMRDLMRQFAEQAEALQVEAELADAEMINESVRDIFSEAA